MDTNIKSIQKPVVFISYAREDKDFVQDLVAALKEQNIEPVGDWLLTSGQDYQLRLRELNLRSSALIFIISPDSIKSESCINELSLALESRKQVLPVSRRDHGEDSLVDSALRSPQWTFIREEDDFQIGIKELVAAINTDFGLMEVHGRLLLSSESWKNNGQNRSYLLRKDGLREAERWLTKTSLQPNRLPQPTPLEVEFIIASQRAQSRGTRIALGVALAVAASLIVLSVVALMKRSEAVENARRAFEVGKRRLLVATLLVNSEGTKLTTVYTGLGDLMFGIRPWSLQAGSLNSLLKRFQAEEPALFVQIFGNGDATLAQKLIDYTSQHQEHIDTLGEDDSIEDIEPVGEDNEDVTENDELTEDDSAQEKKVENDLNLSEEPWVSRFKTASENPRLQAIQFESLTEHYLMYLNQLNQIAPQVNTERGIAFLLDLAFHMGPKKAIRFVKEAQQSETMLTEPEFLQRVRELSNDWAVKQPYVNAAAVDRRRQMFLTTPFFSDERLGFQ